MQTIEYLDPFVAGRLFLSHRCTDHKWSNYLAHALGKHFDVYYSCDGSMLLDDPVVPRQQLVASDLVIFLASPESLNPQSIASHELSIAEILRIKDESALAMVKLDGTKIPTEFSAFSFGQFRWSDRSRDAKALVAAIKNKLADSAGLVARRFPKAHKGTVYFSDLDHQAIVNLLHDYKGYHIIRFNAPLQAFDMGKLIELIQAQSTKRRNKIIENLFKIYLDPDSVAMSAKQNAIFILGKLLTGQKGHANDLKRRMPDFDSPFLLRGYQIALSFLPDAGLIDDYVRSLATESSKEWKAQREVNIRFHIVYYNGMLGALTELRNTLATGKPRNLLSLNAFTIGELSSYERDAVLLNQYKKKLCAAGVDSLIIDEAIMKIRKRK